VESRRKHWGWGYEHEQPSAQELRSTAAFIAGHLGFGSTEPESPVALSDCELPPPRLSPPDQLAAFCFADRY
jgi:alkyldihydroxyacetonephosphate synthase